MIAHEWKLKLRYQTEVILLPVSVMLDIRALALLGLLTVTRDKF